MLITRALFGKKQIGQAVAKRANHLLDQTHVVPAVHNRKATASFI
jgi:hypothetical protein